MQIILIIIIIIGIKLYHVYEDWKLDNYDTSNVSIGKMVLDYKSSPREVRRKMMRGEYNKDENFKI